MSQNVKLNRAGMRALLRSQEVLADMRHRAQRIANTAGEGHEVDSGVGRNRARASVRTVTFDAARAEAIDHTLTRAIDAGR